MKTAEERLEKYMRKTFRGEERVRLAERLPDIAQRTFVEFDRMANIELAVQQILKGEKVVTCDYPRYYMFAKSLCRLVRTYGKTRIPCWEMSYLVSKHMSWGCPEALLERIRAMVMDMLPPTLGPGGTTLHPVP